MDRPMNQIAAGPTAGLPPSPGSQAGDLQYAQICLALHRLPKKMPDVMGNDESQLDI